MKVAVKKVNLYVTKNQYEELMKILQMNQFMMIEGNDNSSKTEDVSKDEELIFRIGQTIKYLEGFREKRKFFNYKEASYEEFDNRSGNYLKLLETIEGLEKRENTQALKIKDLDKEIENYLPFINNELNLEDMSRTRYIDFYHGFIHEKKVEELKELFIRNDIAHSFFGEDKRGLAITFAVLKSDEKTYLQEAKRLDFKEVKMPVYDGNISEYIDNLKIEKIQYEVLLKETQKEVSSYLQNLNDLYIYADQIASDKVRKQAPYEVHSEELNIVKINGWIKSKRENELKEVLTKNEIAYELEDAVVADDEIVPTALENNKFVEPFEMITEQFGTPGGTDLDPNPSMSIWYWIIFGIMMGDIGYGLLLILACGLAIKYLKPKGGTRKLLTVLFYGGFTTVLFGILHGSFFGFDFDLGAIIGSLFNQKWTLVLLNPINDALTMLIYALILGFFQINHGLILKAIRLFKLKDWQGAIGEGIAIVLILTGLGLVVLTFVLPSLSMWVGVSVIILGVFLVLVFTSNNQGILKAITGKLGGLYGLVNQLSNILSYSRLLALALSTAVIAFTFNTLAGMLAGNIFGILLSIVIYVVGHIFNIAMGLLSTYIHDSRLQYVEFYGQFFDGDGRSFRPLSLELNHLNEVINNKDFGGNEV